MSRRGRSFQVPGEPVRYRLRACRRQPSVRRCFLIPSDAPPEPAPIAGSLADGVFVPEYGVRIPWGITRQDLFVLIPRHAFRRTGCWPTLRFTLFGVTKVYGFNFYSRNDGLRAIQSDRRTPRRRMYRRIGHQLIAALGRPNFVDLSLHGQQTWVFGDIVVEQVQMVRGRRGDALEIAVQHHLLHVYRYMRDLKPRV